MNRKFPYRLAVICLATLSAGAVADIVTLKNGNKIEGGNQEVDKLHAGP